jgi:hypothetical protein
MKAEVVRLAGRDPRDNPRFVVTNLPQSPRRVYEIYRERGDVENRLKELHYGLGFDRTSCTAFRANAFRVLLTAAAYVLLQALRQRLAATPAAGLQVGTLRERLFKLGARVQVSPGASCPISPAPSHGSPCGRVWRSRWAPSPANRDATPPSPFALERGMSFVRPVPGAADGAGGPLGVHAVRRAPVRGALTSTKRLLTPGELISRSFTNNAG